MTTLADIALQNAGKRRLFCKVDGLEPILWEDDGTGAPASGTNYEWGALNNFDILTSTLGGWRVAISSSLFIVGDPTAGTGGQVLVYKLIDGTWTYQRTIDNPRATAGERFGDAVAIDAAGTMWIGCPFCAVGGSNRGCVDVYIDEGATLQQQTIQPSDIADGDRFGYDVSGDGSRFAAGSPWDYNKTLQDGSAYTFTWNGSAWVEEQKLDSPQPAVGACFGRSVSLSGTGLAIAQSNKIWVFRYGASWTSPDPAITPFAAPADTEHRDNVSLSGNILAYHDLSASPYPIRVWWYDSSWSEKSTIATDCSGNAAVAASSAAHLIAVGNQADGTLKIYAEDEGVCALIKTVDAPRGSSGFGSHVDINQDASQVWIAEGDDSQPSGDEVSTLGVTVSPLFSRSGIVCLERPTEELSWGLSVGNMSVSPPAITIPLRNICDPQDETSFYFAKLFAPGRYLRQGEKFCHLSREILENRYVEASDVSLWTSQTIASWSNASTVYLPHETFSYTSKAGDIAFAGVTRGLYPCVGSHAALTYKIPADTDDIVGGPLISTVPSSWIGRRLALYVVSFDEMTGQWNSEADSQLLFVGRIKQIRYNGEEGVWELGCENALAELERELGQNMPQGTLKGINLLGPQGLTFEIRQFRDAYYDVDLDQWIPAAMEQVFPITIAPQVFETHQDLAAQIVDAMNTCGCPVRWWLGWDGSKYSLGGDYYYSYLGNQLTRRWEIWQRFDPPVGYCKTLAALGFATYGVYNFFNVIANAELPKWEAEEPPAKAWHPIHHDYNGGKLYLNPSCAGAFDQSARWDYGEDGGTVYVEKCRPTIADPRLEVEDSAYIARYSQSSYISGLNRTELTLRRDDDMTFLGVDAPASEDAVETSTRGGYVAQQDEEPVLVKQIYCPHRLDNTGVARGPFELLLYPLLSSGTVGYAHAKYDALPYEWAGCIDPAVVDVDSFLAADAEIANSPLSRRYRMAIIEPTSPKDLLARECMLFGYALVWDNRQSKLAIKNLRSVRSDMAIVTLDDSNNCAFDERFQLDQSDDTVLNQWEMSFNFNPGTGKYKDKVIVVDDDSQTQLRGTVKSVKLEHPGVHTGETGEAAAQLFEQFLINQRDTFRVPWFVVTRTLAPSLMCQLSIGDTIYFDCATLPDPYGGGTMTTSCNAIVLNVGWDLQEWTGKCVLLLVPRDGTTIYLPWAGSCVTDVSAANGGWDNTNKRFTVLAHEYSPSSDPDDGSWVKAGDVIDVIERDSQDGTTLRWNNITVASDYETDGAGLISVDAGTTLAGWDATREYVIVPTGRVYQSSQMADQHVVLSPADTLVVDSSYAAMRYA